MLFLPLVFGATFSLAPRWRQIFLLVASYLFYMAWKPKYILVIIALTLFDYFAAIAIERSMLGVKRRWLWLGSITANLGMLFVFKYLGFFTREINAVLAFFASGTQVPVVDLLLPIGISFHTFQAMSYTTDTYLGTQKAEKNFLQFALFIAWFPQMVAGPIERGSTLLPQLTEFRIPNGEGVRAALWLILWGFFKKMVVADNLATIVDPFFSKIAAFGPGYAWVAIYSFAMQIFCDFSGYTDIARGSSALFGVRLSENFNSPYLSRSLPEFWKRWHITLSAWFFEYVYFPIVRFVPLASASWLGIISVFLLSGLWHGANWTFLIWGLVNGIFYVAYMLANRSFQLPADGWKKWALIAINFHVVCFCWIFFRAPTFHAAIETIQKLATRPALADFSQLQSSQLIGPCGVLLMAAAAAVAFYRPAKLNWLMFSALSLALVAIEIIFAVPVGQEFIYFQF